MKKFQLLFVAFIALASVSYAQEKLLTLDEIFSTDPKVRVRFSGAPTIVQWAPDGLSFRQAQGGKLMRLNAVTGESREYYDSSRLAAALVNAGVKPEEANEMTGSPDLIFNSNESLIILNNQNDLWVYDVAAGTLKRLTNSKEEEKEPDFSPDGKFVSYVRDNNIFVTDVATGRTKQLTRDGSEKILNGYLDWVYEEELYGRGQKRAYWWSPDSRYIAFLRLDESPVPKFVIPNDIPTDQNVEIQSYPQSGDPNPLVRLGIADVNRSSYIPNAGRIPSIGNRLPSSVLRFGDAVRFVDTTGYKPEDLLIVRVAWTPNSSSVYFQAQNREQTYLDLNAAGLDGKVRKLFTETSPAWVGVNDNPNFLKDGSFIWQSERDGWNHLYHYTADGTLIKRLTEGKWEVRGVLGVDVNNGWIYFSSIKDSPIAENIYRIRTDGGEIQRLSQGEGTHSATFNSTFTHYIDLYSDVNTPAQTRLMRADGTLERVINENRVEALSQYKLSKPDFLKVKTRDGFEMEAMMIKPPDFDATRKYPVFSFTYSGPHAPQVVNRWWGSRGMWFQMLAQKGYIVWVCDNRTASGKGVESTWPVYKNFGQLELRDLEDGVSYLKSLQFVDPDRIGLHGWSYGGFMTAYALTHSKTFKIGIAGGLVSDWRNYDSIYTERYMLTPQNNRIGYDNSSVLKAAKNLSGRLMIIHGQIDDNVHPQNATQLAYELQKANKQFDIMLYPTQRHGLTDPAQIQHWYTMMTDFILKNL
jgi:dipeptidyl-peptidase-4